MSYLKSLGLPFIYVGVQGVALVLAFPFIHAGLQQAATPNSPTSIIPLLGVVGAAGGAGAGILMAHEFEKQFWAWLETEVRVLSAGMGRLGERFTPPMVPESALPRS